MQYLIDVLPVFISKFSDLLRQVCYTNRTSHADTSRFSLGCANPQVIITLITLVDNHMNNSS